MKLQKIRQFILDTFRGQCGNKTQKKNKQFNINTNIID